MDSFLISGDKRLRGTVDISGSKNAALPILAACILCDGEVVLHGVPDLADIRTMEGLLRKLGLALLIGFDVELQDVSGLAHAPFRRRVKRGSKK